MPEQYVQKPGGEAVTLSSLKLPDLQSAANQGYSPVAAPAVPAVPAAAAPVAPKVAPNVLDVSSLSTAPDTSVLAQNTRQTQMTDRIVGDYNAGKLNLSAPSNEAFIQAVAQARYGRAATADELARVGTNQYGLMGSSVKDVLGKFGLLSKIPGFGIEQPETPKPPTEPEKSQTSSNGATKTFTVADQLDALLNNLTFDRTKANLEAGIPEKSSLVNSLKGELDKMKNEMDLNNVLETAAIADVKNRYYEQKDLIEGQTIPMSFINGQLSKLASDTNITLDKNSIATALADATNVYKYNSKLIEYNIALGDLQNAQALVKESAADFKDFNTQKLQILQFQNLITRQDQDIFQQEIDREYEMATAGYTPVAPESLQTLTTSKGTDWIQTNTISINGKTYIKPVETVEQTPDYKNYQLAGGINTGLTFAEWLDRNKTNPDTKPPTEAELRNYGFFTRADQAVTVLDTLDDWVTKLGIAGQTWQLLAPSVLKSDNGKAYEQARRQFTEAYLRRDSGAVISPTEYASADLIYFVQPGDTAKTIAQKKAARGAVLNSLKVGAGNSINQIDSGEGEWSW